MIIGDRFNILYLDSELHFNIFGNLSAQDLDNCQKVCRLFRKVLDKYLKQVVQQSNPPISLKDREVEVINSNIDYEKVFANWQNKLKLAFLSRLDYHFHLGLTYRKLSHDKDEEKNLDKSLYHFVFAADLGHVEAAYEAGCCYKSGKGWEVDLVKALDYFEFAAHQGHVEAAYEAGSCYQYGEGCEKDKCKEWHYFVCAARKGHMRAQWRVLELSGHHNIEVRFAKGETQFIVDGDKLVRFSNKN